MASNARAVLTNSRDPVSGSAGGFSPWPNAVAASDSAASGRVIQRTTRIDSYFNPSIDGTSVVYIRQTLQGMQVEVLNLQTSRSRSIFSVNKGSGRFLWTTAIFAGRRYFTVYNSTSSSIHRG